MSIYKEPPPGMFVVPDTVDMTKIHALITGPFDTPYEGGFFLFVFRCPPDYPIHPPRVKLMTTGNNTVRFNPNFYRNGKVCLSILGTWTGPAWSPAQSISSVLISIQSLMTENPYHNEPGFEQLLCLFSRGVMEKSFLEYYDFYEVACKDRLHLQGQTMQDPFGEKRGHFDYQSLLMRLGLIRQKVLERLHNENAEMDSDSSSSGTETDLHGSLRGWRGTCVSPSKCDIIPQDGKNQASLDPRVWKWGGCSRPDLLGSRASGAVFIPYQGPSHCSRQTKEKEQWWSLGC
ncbi:hypothetical protein E2I00_019324 [Balaenoptera physalus]|uniref:Ubiquitin-conjugating enzyme E2 Z n=1 Tax=Balaenoptera physalus TaxID=9770 RepID=A0A6A1Q1U5_BALPH|nr:hypothetical protein E2I00_019324 [Balaenoptera physalus]